MASWRSSAHWYLLSSMPMSQARLPSTRSQAAHSALATAPTTCAGREAARATGSICGQRRGCSNPGEGERAGLLRSTRLVQADGGWRPR